MNVQQLLVVSLETSDSDLSWLFERFVRPRFDAATARGVQSFELAGRPSDSIRARDDVAHRADAAAAGRIHRPLQQSPLKALTDARIFAARTNCSKFNGSNGRDAGDFGGAQRSRPRPTDGGRLCADVRGPIGTDFSPLADARRPMGHRPPRTRPPNVVLELSVVGCELSVKSCGTVSLSY